MNKQQIDALKEIERQVQIMWAAELPVTPVPDDIYYMKESDILQDIIDTKQEKIIDLKDFTFFTPKVTIQRPVELRNGRITATPNVNDLIDVAADNITLRNIKLLGDDTTKRGVVINGKVFRMYSSSIMNIRRKNTECQAIATWNGDDAFISDTILEASTQSVLIGGSAPDVPNHIPTKIYFDMCVFTRPYSWLNQGWGCKTIFEVKSGRDIKVTNSILENMRTDGQTGVAITLTGSQYGNSPLNIVENVEFHTNLIRNASSGVSAIGWSQHQAEAGREMLKGRDYRFINNTWDLSKILHSGQGALAILGREVDTVLFEDNRVSQEGGDAFIRFTDKLPVTNLLVTMNIINNIGKYGVFSSLGSRGINWIKQANPGFITGNTLGGADSIFRNNFPNNIYE